MSENEGFGENRLCDSCSSNSASDLNFEKKKSSKKIGSQIRQKIDLAVTQIPRL